MGAETEDESDGADATEGLTAVALASRRGSCASSRRRSSRWPRAIRAEQERRKKRRKLHAVSLSAFTADKLQVPRKAGGREPLILNAVQEEVHALIQNQLNETGMVRTLILKARQLGISTYVAARWYWHVQRDA